MVVNVEDVEVTTVVWRNNKVVSLISNFVGKEPTSNAERFDKKQKQNISIDCPNIVKDYNKYMGK